MAGPDEAESALRADLGVEGAQGPVIILGMDAHLDWDWLGPFEQLVREPGIGGPGSAQQIIEQAWQLMSSHQGATPYRYSVCEMGFLRAVLDLEPNLLEQFRRDHLATQLAIEGGGITSPDNLLTHGEAFIRCYLLGTAWQRATLGVTTTVCYLPDDFGHDAQLPVVLEAMGFAGVTFSRLPGSWPDLGQPLDKRARASGSRS